MLSPWRISSARILIALVLSVACATSQRRFAISLKSRRIEATESATNEFVRRAATSRDGIHGYAFVMRAPSAADRESLSRRGVNILTRLTRTVYIARVMPNAAIRDTAVTSRVRFFAISEPGDRVLPPLWNGSLNVFARRVAGGDAVSDVVNPDSTVNVTVRLHDDVPAQAESSIVASLPRSRRLLRSLWAATLSREVVRRLAENDAVRWIDVVAGRSVSDIDKTRDALHVDAVQLFDDTVAAYFGLTGSKSTVAVFDDGIDAASADFHVGGRGGGSRVTTTRPPGAHGTYVAGIIGASGQSSHKLDSWGNSNGTSPFQWRGMAPLTHIVDAKELWELDASRAPELRALAIIADLSNHSYTWDAALKGVYGELGHLHDAMIRGDDAGDGNPLTPRLHVHSAGNSAKYPPDDGANQRTGEYQRGFFSVDNQMKNALSVGNYYLDSARLSATSSLGPAYDGRIKPDVVAPGSYLTALGWCGVDGNADHNPFYFVTPSSAPTQPCDTKPAGTVRRNFYFPQSGTSGAAAVVAGMLTLVADQLKTSGAWYFDPYAPLPSTLRAIAIHSATDLQRSTKYFDINSNPQGTLPVQVFPGPDFATGYGLVDAQAAVNVALHHMVREGVINATCDKRTMTLDVSDPALPVKVTLAWDDPASVAVEVANDDPLLVNDLDLVLIDPANNKHYPWLLNQQAMANGAPIADDAQTCGTSITVNRALTPATHPYYAGRIDFTHDRPGSVDDPINASDLKAATTGKDHLNNVEQVVAPGMVGRWTVEVSGFAVDVAPQRYSLVGVPDPSIVVPPFPVVSTCGLVPIFCRLRLYPICRRDPRVCENPEPIPIESDTFALRFRGANRTKVLPLSAMCSALSAAHACTPADLREGVPLTLRFGGNAQSLGIEVFDARGKLLARDTTASDAKELRIPASAGERFVIVRLGAPGDGANTYAVNTYAVPIAVRRR